MSLSVTLRPPILSVYGLFNLVRPSSTPYRKRSSLVTDSTCRRHHHDYTSPGAGSREDPAAESDSRSAWWDCARAHAHGTHSRASFPWNDLSWLSAYSRICNSFTQHIFPTVSRPYLALTADIGRFYPCFLETTSAHTIVPRARSLSLPRR